MTLTLCVEVTSFAESLASNAEEIVVDTSSVGAAAAAGRLHHRQKWRTVEIHAAPLLTLLRV